MSSVPVDVKHAVRFRFGGFELSASQAALWQDGVRVPLTPKPMAALIVS